MKIFYSTFTKPHRFLKPVRFSLSFQNLLVISCLLFFTCFVSIASAQTFRLSGTVLDRNLSPLGNANILVQNTAYATFTDEKGQFVLQLPQGNYTLILSYLGNKKTETVALSEDLVLNAVFENIDIELQEVMVSSTRAGSKDPMTFVNIGKEALGKRNLGQDIPILLNNQTAVVSTSDNGSGVGYTGLRVRGSDATRVNVTINGVPYNDAESQATFWVDIPDFVSSVENVQIQRGVGTSTNGAGAFGASINFLSDAVSTRPYAEVSGSFGSFDTRKATAKFSTGILNDHFEFNGRGSIIKSNGYIDRATSDLKSYYLSAAYFDGKTQIKAIAFGGSEVTYQAWFGIDKETLKTNRRFNPAGMYSDDEGNIFFYENQVDDYKQDNYQLHIFRQLDENWSANLAIHYTFGRGFFEEYKEDADFATYGFTPVLVDGNLISSTDLVQRQWLDNDFYGTTFSVKYKSNPVEFDLGGAWNQYDGEHFGKLVFANIGGSKSGQELYFNVGNKTDANIYAKANYQLSEKLSIYGDLQLRYVDYSIRGEDLGFVDLGVKDFFAFFNPKGGLSYQMNEKSNLYASYAKAHREPNRTDFENGSPEPESLDDYEAGWRYNDAKKSISLNVYWMDYSNQLVLTGALDDVGNPIRQNSGKSYRIGVEAEATLMLGNRWVWSPNAAFSSNKNRNFKASLDGETIDLGTTHLPFSPEIVLNNAITYLPKQNIEISLLSKYVDEQYMGNLDHSSSKLGSYFVSDLSVRYSLGAREFFKDITFTFLVNNLFDRQYVSNGFWGTFNFENPDKTSGTETGFFSGFYPQAGINVLGGISLKF
ncbi:MAG: TonB-dependent receptor [Flavobacteriales bacterium CG_4_9_14_3_um_filter_40_17]|nr:MAG: TonB-dependent receptor [Flavobacteriales bacterium CG_4_9_14_3_um_filter_40_17]